MVAMQMAATRDRLPLDLDRQVSFVRDDREPWPTHHCDNVTVISSERTTVGGFSVAKDCVTRIRLLHHVMCVQRGIDAS
jgi:hypothetical protein